MKDLISVIIPIYNVEKYLNKCIDSIINQTYKNLEIILVDDGSPDNCPQICDEYAKKDSRIKVIHKKNGGVSSARNVGLINSTGNYIGFIDPDDYIEPIMYEKLLKVLKESNTLVSMCGFYKIKDNKIVKTDNYDEKIISSEKLLKDIFNYTSMGTLCNKLFAKEIFFDINNNQLFFNETIHYCEDVLMLETILSNKNNIAIHNQPLYNYIVSSNSICHGNISEKKLTGIISMDLILNLCRLKFSNLLNIADAFCINCKVRIFLELYYSNINNKKKFFLNIQSNFKNHKPISLKDKLKCKMIIYIPYMYIILKRILQIFNTKKKNKNGRFN